MTAQIIEVGKQYWSVAKAYHDHRDNPTIRAVAVNQMKELVPATKSEAVQRRMNSFISKNQIVRKPLGWNPPPTVA